MLQRMHRNGHTNTYKDDIGLIQEMGSTTRPQVHMIIVALDYKGTGNELSCTKDGDNVQVLAKACGVTTVWPLYNNDGNLSCVVNAIQRVGGKCSRGDFFIFYYSGHGSEVTDLNGDERDGKDECFCLVTPQGRLDWNYFMTDDQFAETVTQSVPEGVNIIVLSDCCHSGTIADFRSPCWGHRAAISISGCRDSQTSGDTGKGGIFTHAMLMATAELQHGGNEFYTCEALYNKTLDMDNRVFNSEQEITFEHTAAAARQMVWPLVPLRTYQAPWARR
jgi:hypothetical protein